MYVAVQEISQGLYQAAYLSYLQEQFFFPLIGAVLLNKQAGTVYVDSLQQPRQFYVEHRFGFAQVFGQPVDSFENNLKEYFLSKCFAPDKVRLYVNGFPAFFYADDKFKSFCAYRQRFELMQAGSAFFNVNSNLYSEKNISVLELNSSNISQVEKVFGVVQRFWKSYDGFVAEANASVILYNNQMAAICYAAAVANNFAEIDVLTLSEYRKTGLGKIAVRSFIDKCLKKAILPLWDAFINNTPSVALAKSLGFVEKNAPYTFFTIPK